MEGMGHSHQGPSPTLALLGMTVALVAIAVAVVVLGTSTVEAVEGNGTEQLPDLVITEVTNLTPVYQGDDTFFNVTIGNLGTEAYLARTSGDLEVFAYRDDEPVVAGFTRVYQDIYRKTNVTINLRVVFDEVGNHTLRVLLDPSGQVAELNDTNNRYSVEVVVVPSEENRPPHADGGNDRVGYINEPVYFSALYSDDPDGDSLTYTWVFGDGGEGRGMVTNHTYIYTGSYGVSLMVSDGEKVDVDTFSVLILKPPVNHPPEAVITVAKTKVEVNESLTLDGRNSIDVDMDALKYEWDLDATDGLDDWVRGSPMVASWASTGAYVVTLRVSDDKEEDTTTVTIIVVAPPPPNKSPLANAGSDLVVKEGEEVRIVGEGSDPDGTIVSWEWDVDGDEVFDTFSEDDGILVRSFPEVGTFTLWLRVTDDRGAVSRDSVVVMVEEDKGEGTESPGPAALVAALAMVIVTIPLNRARKASSGSRTRTEKGVPSLK